MPNAQYNHVSSAEPHELVKVIPLVSSSLPNVFNKFYFWYSLLFLILRMVSMFVSASVINENAKKPLIFFRLIPSEGWCEELQRYFDQCKTHPHCLSGKNFFVISRTVLFTMTGVLVTYVLVLLQFEPADEDLNRTVNCFS